MKVTKKVLGVVATLLLIVALFSIPTATAYADDPYLDSNIPTSGMTDKDIEAMNKHLIAWLIDQNKVFRAAYDIEVDFQALIDLQVARGRDSLALDIMLGTFDTTLRDAQAVQDTAALLIGAQFGFDAQGHVTNRTAALQTVTEARYNLRDARQRLRDGIRALHRSYAAWHYKIIHGKPDEE
jgi:hypothetical protein